MIRQQKNEIIANVLKTVENVTRIITVQQETQKIITNRTFAHNVLFDNRVRPEKLLLWNLNYLILL